MIWLAFLLDCWHRWMLLFSGPLIALAGVLPR